MVIKDSCLYFGLTGLLSRSINLVIDARFTGYELYEELNYPISYPTIGDCLDRYILRLNEIIESSRIIYGLLYLLLHSAFSSNVRFSLTMELLIEEFLIHFPLILSLTLQSKLSIESSKGIYTIYLLILLAFFILILSPITYLSLFSSLFYFMFSWIYRMGYIVPFLTISSILTDVYVGGLIFIGVIFNSYIY